MTLHYEAMRAEADYRFEQARRSWPTQSARSRGSTAIRLWQAISRWARRPSNGPRTAGSAATLDRDRSAKTVRVHITCWTDDSQPAHEVLEAAQEALAQRFTSTPEIQLQNCRLTHPSSL